MFSYGPEKIQGTAHPAGSTPCPKKPTLCQSIRLSPGDPKNPSQPRTPRLCVLLYPPAHPSLLVPPFLYLYPPLLSQKREKAPSVTLLPYPLCLPLFPSPHPTRAVPPARPSSSQAWSTWRTGPASPWTTTPPTRSSAGIPTRTSTSSARTAPREPGPSLRCLPSTWRKVRAAGGCRGPRDVAVPRFPLAGDEDTSLSPRCLLGAGRRSPSPPLGCCMLAALACSPRTGRACILDILRVPSPRPGGQSTCGRADA